MNSAVLSLTVPSKTQKVKQQGNYELWLSDCTVVCSSSYLLNLTVVLFPPGFFLSTQRGVLAYTVQQSEEAMAVQRASELGVCYTPCYTFFWSPLCLAHSCVNELDYRLVQFL
jgi:hypothetical protein